MVSAKRIVRKQKKNLYSNYKSEYYTIGTVDGITDSTQSTLVAELFWSPNTTEAIESRSWGVMVYHEVYGRIPQLSVSGKTRTQAVDHIEQLVKAIKTPEWKGIIRQALIEARGKCKWYIRRKE